MTRHPFVLLILLLIAGLAHAQSTTQTAARRSPEQVLKGVKAPAGFEMTLFAQPPEVNYPACLTTIPHGEVFVGIDEQGSLGKDKDRGRIVRCVDTNGDGVADHIKPFVKLDHPRGMVWDDATRSLYVLHPPDLTRHFDDDNDGVADRAEALVTGLYNPLAQNERGADHTTNGIQLGIDGWIYVAVGDFGVFDATGADGTKLKLRGGGIVRVRTDGSGLEVYAHGTRNIYDIAIDPVMNIFTRDNTNDGGGWNDRLTYDSSGSRTRSSTA
jgi:glucose/arabinose dehydrogenase